MSFRSVIILSALHLPTPRLVLRFTGDASPPVPLSFICPFSERISPACSLARLGQFARDWFRLSRDDLSQSAACSAPPRYHFCTTLTTCKFISPSFPSLRLHLNMLTHSPPRWHSCHPTILPRVIHCLMPLARNTLSSSCVCGRLRVEASRARMIACSSTVSVCAFVDDLLLLLSSPRLQESIR